MVDTCRCLENAPCFHDAETCWWHLSPHGECPTVHIFWPFMGGETCSATVHNEDGDIDSCNQERGALVHQVWSCKADEASYHDRGPCTCQRAGDQEEAQ